MIDLKQYMDFMDKVGARYGVHPDDIIVVVDPDYQEPPKTADGKLIFPQIIDPEKYPPWIRNDHINEVLFSSAERFIEYLMLHEIYHLKTHFRNVNELTWEERGRNDFEADQWALEEMELL